MILTITTKTAATKVSLYPALTEACEIKLLNFHKPTLWLKFNRPQEIKQLEGPLDKQGIERQRNISKLIITIAEGYYTLESLQEQIIREQYNFPKPKSFIST